jgi:hypothetical protein
MLDIHVLTMPYQNELWLGQCLSSIEAAIKNSGVDVDVHLVPGVEGHVGQARKNGFSKGHHPWVTWVDADDWLAVDAIGTMLPHLSSSIDMVCCKAYNVHKDRTVLGLRGLVIVKRSAAEQFDWDSYPYCGTCQLQDSLTGKYLDYFGCYKRKYDSAASSLRGNKPCG